MDTRRATVRIAALASALVIAAAAWYLGSPLFIRTTADEALPTVAGSASAPSGATPPGSAPTVDVSRTAEPPRTTLQLRGELRYVDALHNGKGVVFLGVISGCCPVVDRYFLRFEDVAITNAPDVHVYLSRETGGTWSEATSTYVGPLKATNGSFNYDVSPQALAGAKSVVVWCRAFNVLVTWADLGPA